MLQTFRDNLKGTVAYILIGLIVVIFALTGVEALFTGSSNAGKAASVNGEDIADVDLRRGIQIRRDQMLSRFGTQLPAELVTDENLREPVLNDLILREVIHQRTLDGGMAIADRTIDDIIIGAPQFQQDGKFSPQLYAQLARNMGFTPMGYKNQIKKDMLANQLLSGLSVSGFVTPAELEQIVTLTEQTRDYYYLTIPASTVDGDIAVTDEAVQNYYEANKTRFVTREQVSVDYIDVSITDLAADIVIDEGQLQQQYEQDVAAFKGTSRQAAHILIEAKDDGSHTQLLADLQAKLASGEDFAELAKTYSEDLGSKAAGGDLGYTTGDVFPAPFEEALAALDVNQVSAPVETDAGIHLIKLLALKAATPPTFEEERGRIEANLKRAEAENRFVEILQALPDLTYNADNLDDAAAELGLTKKTSAPITRSGGAGVFADSRVLAAIFSDDVLEQGANSELLELAQDHLLVLRAAKHEESRQQTLDEVKTIVQANVKAEQTKAALIAKADALKARILAGASVEAVATASGMQWQVKAAAKRFAADLERELNDFVFTLPKPDATPVVQGTQLENGDYVVVSLTAVTPGKFVADSEVAKSLRAGLSQERTADEYQSYQSVLMQQADVDIYQN